MLTSVDAAALAGATTLGCTFLACSYARGLTETFRRRWASFAAGVAIAYVFVDVLPELATGGTVLVSELGEDRFAADKRVYLIALAGLLVFSSLARLRKLAESGKESSPRWYLRIHVGAFAAYSFLMGYLTVGRSHDALSSLIVYTIAMSLHAVLIDEGLVREHGAAYIKTGRGLLALSVVSGWAVAAADAMTEVTFTRLFAFLAGGVVITSAQSDMPEEDDRRLAWLTLGAVLYAAILLAI